MSLLKGNVNVSLLGALSGSMLSITPFSRYTKKKRFQLLKCEYLLLFSVFHDSKLDLVQ